MEPLRGLCSKSSEQQPPVASMACRCRCGSTSIDREPPASSDVNDGATVSVPAGLPTDRAGPGGVSRVGRESWDMNLAGARSAVLNGGDCTPSTRARQLVVTTRRTATSAGRSILWRLALLRDLAGGQERPPAPFGRLTTGSVRSVRTEKACRAPHDVVG